MRHIKIFEDFRTSIPEQYEKISYTQYIQILVDNLTVKISDRNLDKIDQLITSKGFRKESLDSYIHQGIKVRGYGKYGAMYRSPIRIDTSTNPRIVIHEIDDEYFIVKYEDWELVKRYPHNESDMCYYFYKCDQIDGLMNLIEVLPDYHNIIVP
jgi:hypothetical protein